MRKLSLGLSFAAMVMFAACGDENGSSADDLGESSSSSEVDLIKSSASDKSSSSSSEEVNPGDSKDSSSSSSEDIGSSESEDSSSSNEEESSCSEELESSSSEESSSSISSSSSDASIYSAKANTLTDLRNGRVYRTTTIQVEDDEHGMSYPQVWMAENLDFVTENSWCGGGDETKEGNCSVYGRLYTWSAAVGKTEDECGAGKECGLGTGDIRGVCPKGWHLPSKAELELLISSVGGCSIAKCNTANTAGSALKSSSGWQPHNGIENRNTYGFSALPAGYRRSSDGTFRNEGYEAYFWSSTEYDSNGAYHMSMFSDINSAYLLETGNGKDAGISVRCLKKL